MSNWPIQVHDATGVVRIAGHAKGTPPPTPGIVDVASVAVSRAQLLGFGNPVTIVPGVGGKMIVPLGGVVEYHAGSTPYTDHGCNLAVYWNTGNGILFNDTYFVMQGNGFWTQAASQVAPIVPRSIEPATGQPSYVVGGWSLFTAHDLVIGSHALVGNPTGGNGTLLVTVFYCLVAVQP